MGPATESKQGSSSHSSGNGEKSRTPEPSRIVKSWEPYVPTGPEGHEAMEEVQDVISFADTGLKEKDEPTGEVPEHVVEALAKAESGGAASEKVDTDRLTPHEGEAGEIQLRVVDALREVLTRRSPSISTTSASSMM